MKNYSDKKRFYHNFSHIENLLAQLGEFKEMFSDWETVVLAVFYHDVIYNTRKNDNEEKSAMFAAKQLAKLNFPSARIAKCKRLILATKLHENVNDNDINLFTDADLSILGSEWETYLAYAKNIRKEYNLYPDLVYNPGRKKALKHFLDMQRIFKTEEFFERHERLARKNLECEFRKLEEGALT